MASRAVASVFIRTRAEPPRLARAQPSRHRRHAESAVAPARRCSCVSPARETSSPQRRLLAGGREASLRREVITRDEESSFHRRRTRSWWRPCHSSAPHCNTRLSSPRRPPSSGFETVSTLAGLRMPWNRQGRRPFASEDSRPSKSSGWYSAWRCNGIGRSPTSSPSWTSPCRGAMAPRWWRRARLRRRASGWVPSPSGTCSTGALRSGVVLASWRDLALYGADGSMLRIADTDDNREHFGLAGDRAGASAYPLVRVATLMALRSRVLAGAAFGPYGTSELKLCDELWTHVPADSLTVVDKLFYSAPFLLGLQARC